MLLINISTNSKQSGRVSDQQRLQRRSGLPMEGRCWWRQTSWAATLEGFYLQENVKHYSHCSRRLKTTKRLIWPPPGKANKLLNQWQDLPRLPAQYLLPPGVNLWSKASQKEKNGSGSPRIDSVRKQNRTSNKRTNDKIIGGFWD